MTSTLEKLKRIMSHAPDIWLVPLLTLPQQNGIDSDEELATFIAEIAYESSEFTHLVENLNYSAQGLANTWARFSETRERRGPPNELAREITHNPKRIANIVYANRLGNGDEDSGDGWTYRGMGPIQITGKELHEKFAADTGLDPKKLAIDPHTGILSAIWFWKLKHLDKYDDDKDILKETRILNGGALGIARRQEYLDLALGILQEGEDTDIA
jgi:putative chitinase